MNIFEILKQFKNIEPDLSATENSKRIILASPREEKVGMKGIFVFLRTLETGVAVILAGFFVLIFTGSFSGTSMISPLQYSVIDPQGLHAEAQAIDMQIQLANVNYLEVTSTAESTPQATGNMGASSRALIKGTSTPTSTDSGTVSSTPSSTISIDQALEELAK